MGNGESISINLRLKKNIEFLRDEIAADLNHIKCPHLRHLSRVDIRQNEITYEIQPNFKNMLPIRLKTFQPNQRISLLTQLILGVYELHSNGMIGRCFNVDNIVFEKQQLILLKFGYFHTISDDKSRKAVPPEILYYQMVTFSTDFWLIGQVMWQIIMNKPDASVYSDGPVYQETHLLQQMLNFALKNPHLKNQEIEPNLRSLIESLLYIYPGNRIDISKLLSNNLIDLPQLKRQEMINFYQNNSRNLDSLLKQFWSSQKREAENGKNLFYQFEDTKIWKHFSPLIIRIQLLILAFHLCFHLPYQTQEVYRRLYQTLLWLIVDLSKKLKIKVIRGEIDNTFGLNASAIFADENYSKFKEQILNTHNQLLETTKMLSNVKKEQLQTLTDASVSIFLASHINLIPGESKLTLHQQLLLKIFTQQQPNLALTQDNYNLSLKDFFQLTIRAILAQN